MKKSSMALMLIISLIFLFNFHPTTAHKVKYLFGGFTNVPNTLETYIVHVNLLENKAFSGPEDVKNWYHSFLPTTTAISNQPSSSRMLYSYLITMWLMVLRPDCQLRKFKPWKRLKGL
ncbi:hypothetical protein CsSME_00050310 [Camellia sinensis var. sinensis]